MIMSQELFHLWNKEFGQRVAIFGVMQTEFLIFSPDGWAWAPMRDFTPLDARIYDYRTRVQYVNANDRPGMVPEPPKLVLQTHSEAIDLPWSNSGESSSKDWDHFD